jgi:hypothetical protein
VRELLDLNPRWVGDGDGRLAVGISFECPGACCAAKFMKERLAVLFWNPITGGDPVSGTRHFRRAGETFTTLTLKPAIDCSADGHWTGWIKDGKVYP